MVLNIDTVNKVIHQELVLNPKNGKPVAFLNSQSGQILGFSQINVEPLSFIFHKVDTFMAIHKRNYTGSSGSFTGSTHHPEEATIPNHLKTLGNVHKYSGGGGSKKFSTSIKGGSKKFRPSKRGGQTSFDHPNTQFFVRATRE